MNISLSSLIEYPTRGEADEALRRLDGAEFKGRRVQLTEEVSLTL